jgi:amino acid adenylation domain-containing protein
MNNVMNIPHPTSAGLLGGFLRSRAAWPEAPALRVGGEQYSYRQLDALARRWAGALIEVAGRRPRRVAVFGARSLISYAGVLAALYAGAAFVPLNPRYPVARTRAMLEQAEVDALIADAGAAPLLAELLAPMALRPPLLLPDGELSGRAAPLAAPAVVAPSDPAYLLFTSGSTGVPKGVPVTHGNVTAFLAFNQARYALTPDDRVSQTFDQTFDLSVFDLFMAWGGGATLCAMQAEDLLAPLRYVRENGITVWFSVPSIVNGMLRLGLLAPDSMRSLRLSLFCGEALPRKVAEAWSAAAPQALLENLYGPTELTIACAVYRWDPRRSPDQCVHGVAPIGRVYDGLPWELVGANGQPVGPDEDGELCVAGSQVFPGYWRKPELTAERMLALLDADGVVRRYYRTGDLVRRLPGGVLAYLGRLDQQVKMNGHRIELGEIEAQLCRIGCGEAAAVAFPDAARPSEIVAFVTGAADPAQLRAQLRQRLPAYLVPRRIVAIDAMPLNVNGKTDRRALLALCGEPAAAA